MINFLKSVCYSKKTIFWLIICLVFLSCSSIKAQDDSFESLIDIVPDTGNMNEESDAVRKFAARFTVKLGTSTPEIYKEPQVATGTTQSVFVKAYISWRNEYPQEVFSDSFMPLENGEVITSKTFKFSVSPPSTWAKQSRFIIVAKFGSPPVANPFTFEGRGDIWDNKISMPPPVKDISLGTGSLGYESLDFFKGTTGKQTPDGKVEIHFEVGVKILKDPLTGNYDPVKEGVRVWVDPTGGVTPTKLLYSEAKLAGAWWVAHGSKNIPFVMVFKGKHEFSKDTPGVIVGGVGLSWPPWPMLGANTVWGQQNTYTWMLPPLGIEVKVPELVYQGVNYELLATTKLRSQQIADRIVKYVWHWEDGSAFTDSKPGQATSIANKIYDSPGLKDGICVVTYKNSDSKTTTFEMPFKVKVLELPKIYPPSQIGIRCVSSGKEVLFPGEDKFCSYYGRNSSPLICQANHTENYFVFYRFFEELDSDDYEQSTYLPGKSAFQNVRHKFSKLGEKKVELWVRYKKARLNNGKLENIVGPHEGYTHELLATRYVTVESQQVLEGDINQRITFAVSVDNANEQTDYISQNDLGLPIQSVKVNFTGKADIFYATRNENSNLALDQKSGVRPGSVRYRWKIITPDGDDAFTAGMVDVSDENLLSWQNLGGALKGIAPVSVTFKVPFGTCSNPERYYRVFIEAEYKELSWKPVYSKNDATKIIDWEDNLTYANNCRIRKIKYGSSDSCSSSADFRDLSVDNPAPPLNKEGNDLLYDGSSMLRVKINDLVPARFRWVKTPQNCTTGDPIAEPEIRVLLTDNNPDATFDLTEIRYRRFNEDSYSLSSELTARIPVSGYKYQQQLKPAESHLFEGLASVSANLIFPISTMNEAAKDSRIVALYSDTEKRLPDSYATTMDKPYDGKFNLEVFAHVDDGTRYFIASESTISVVDNDAPEIIATIVEPKNNTSRSFSALGGINDELLHPGKIRLVSRLNELIKFDEEIEDIEPGQPNSGFKFSVDQLLCVKAHQRFLCTVEIIDNVKPDKPLILKTNLSEENKILERKVSLDEKKSGKFSGSVPNFLFYKRPTATRYFTVYCEDYANNIRGIQFPIKVAPTSFSEIRVLQQKNK